MLSIPLLVVLGVRRDGQKVLLAVKNMGGETEAAWRHVLEDLLGRGLKAPELLIVDGGKGLEAALASLWSDILVQRCTVRKERNLLAHAPKALHDEVKADYTDMMYAENAEQVRKKRKAFLAKWRLRCRGVADSLEEAGERLFTLAARYMEKHVAVRCKESTAEGIRGLLDKYILPEFGKLPLLAVERERVAAFHVRLNGVPLRGEPGGGADVAHVRDGRGLGDGPRRHQPLPVSAQVPYARARAVPDRHRVPPPRRGSRRGPHRGRGVGPCRGGDPAADADRVPQERDPVPAMD